MDVPNYYWMYANRNYICHFNGLNRFYWMLHVLRAQPIYRQDRYLMRGVNWTHFASIDGMVKFFLQTIIGVCVWFVICWMGGGDTQISYETDFHLKWKLLFGLDLFIREGVELSTTIEFHQSSVTATSVRELA